MRCMVIKSIWINVYVYVKINVYIQKKNLL